MIQKVWINESFRLSYIDIFIKKLVQECSLHIHFVKLELQVTARARRTLMDSMRATGANVSSKSTPSTLEYF